MKNVDEFFCNQLHDVLKVNGIFTIHYFKYGKNFNFPEESHNFWELVFIDSGEAIAISNKNKFKLTQSQVIFHKPNVSHTILTEDKFCNSVILSFEASGRMMSFFEDKIFTLTPYEKDLLQKVVFEGKKSFKGKLNLVNQKKMEKREDAPFGTEQIIKNNIELLLISIVRNNAEQKTSKKLDFASVSSHGEQIVKRILEILEARVHTTVNLDEIAKDLYFSKTYVKSVFKKYVGTSIIQYFNRLKIDEAKRLISLNEFSYTEIAAKLGFSSVHYFTRLFKSLTDMTPSEYQKSIKADNVLD